MTTAPESRGVKTVAVLFTACAAGWFVMELEVLGTRGPRWKWCRSKEAASHITSEDWVEVANSGRRKHPLTYILVQLGPGAGME